MNNKKKVVMTAIAALTLSVNTVAFADIVGFKDVKVSDWFSSSVNRVTAAGIMKADSKGNFNPQAPVTRAELASVTDQVLNSISTSKSRFNVKDISKSTVKIQIGKTELVSEQETAQYKMKTSKVTGYIDSTGFFVSDKYILTNQHVIADMGEDDILDIILYNGSKIMAKVVKADVDTDLALLETYNYQGVPLSFTDKVDIGEDIFTVGHNTSNQVCLDFSVSAGVVSDYLNQNSTQYKVNDFKVTPFIIGDITFNKGNSGGAVVNTKSEVIGVAAALLRDFDNKGVIIPTGTVRTFLKGYTNI